MRLGWWGLRGLRGLKLFGSEVVEGSGLALGWNGLE